MSLNRRQWLKSAGIASGAFSFLGTTTAAIPSFHEYLSKQDTNHVPPDTLVKLSSNENPYGPSEKVRKALVENFDSICRYPWEDRTILREKLAKKEGVTPEHILLTVGSTEALKITALAYGLNGGEVIAGSPTFETMLHYAEHFGAFVNRVPVKEGTLVLDIEKMEKRITSNTRLIFLCNPNNPTGTILPADKLRDFCETASKKTMIFSGEAYYDYVTVPNYPSMVELVKDNQNVIVSRTFSKVYGLAGIRLGYIVARPDIIARVKKCQIDRPNMLALHAAKVAMDEVDFHQYSVEMNAKARQKIYTSLDDLGLEYIESHTNFIFFKTGVDIRDFNKSMQEQGVKVGRPFPPYMEWCRISTGKLEEVDQFTAALRSVMT